MSSQFDQIINRRTIDNLNKWKWYAEDVLPMWLADMDFLTPAPILSALQKRIDHGILGYESASPSLFELIAERLKKLYAWEVAPDDIFPIPSVSIGYRMAASVCCKAGEGVLIQPPVYYDFIDFPDSYHLVRQEAALQCRVIGRILHYELDKEIFVKSFHSRGAKTSMFLLCNPHNPIGQIFSAEELEWMANVCANNEVMICSDDIHHELLLGEASYMPLAAMSPKISRNTITLLGPGKTFNVSGLGCAFAIIPDDELRQRYTHQLKHQSLDVNSLGLTAARVAYSGECDEWLGELRQYLTANRDYLVDFVEKELPGMRTTVPQATYLAWLDCNPYIASGVITGTPYDFFLERGKVALYDGKAFGAGGEGFVRINFACPRSILETGLERLATALNG